MKGTIGISSKGTELNSVGGDRGDLRPQLAREKTGTARSTKNSNRDPLRAEIGRKDLRREDGRSRFSTLNGLIEEGDKAGETDMETNEGRAVNVVSGVAEVVNRGKKAIEAQAEAIDVVELCASDTSLIQGVKPSLSTETGEVGGRKEVVSMTD